MGGSFVYVLCTDVTLHRMIVNVVMTPMYLCHIYNHRASIVISSTFNLHHIGNPSNVSRPNYRHIIPKSPNPAIHHHFHNLQTPSRRRQATYPLLPPKYQSSNIRLGNSPPLSKHHPHPFKLLFPSRLGRQITDPLGNHNRRPICRREPSIWSVKYKREDVSDCRKEIE